MNSKRLWKDMRLVTLISWYSLVNGLVAMVRRIRKLSQQIIMNILKCLNIIFGK